MKVIQVLAFAAVLLKFGVRIHVAMVLCTLEPSNSILGAMEESHCTSEATSCWESCQCEEHLRHFQVFKTTSRGLVNMVNQNLA
jgi:hypothetical protein